MTAAHARPGRTPEPEILAADMTPGMVLDVGWCEHTVADVTVHQPGYRYPIATGFAAHADRYGYIAVRWAGWRRGRELHPPESGMGVQVTPGPVAA